MARCVCRVGLFGLVGVAVAVEISFTLGGFHPISFSINKVWGSLFDFESTVSEAERESILVAKRWRLS